MRCFWSKKKKFVNADLATTKFESMGTGVNAIDNVGTNNKQQFFMANNITSDVNHGGKNEPMPQQESGTSTTKSCGAGTIATIVTASVCGVLGLFCYAIDRCSCICTVGHHVCCLPHWCIPKTEDAKKTCAEWKYEPAGECTDPGKPNRDESKDSIADVTAKMFPETCCKA